MTRVDWYFDFISPYAFLQLERDYDWLASIPVAPKPVLFAGLLERWGQKGPAEIGPKRLFTYRQVQWIAQREGLQLRFPPRHPFNPIRELRLAVALDTRLDAVRTIFRHIWGGGDVDTPEGWSALLAKLDVPDADALLATDAVKAKLRANGEEAIAAGVFGVPSIVVDGLVFWGQDATAMAADYLRDPASFRSSEMQRIESLPVGVSRASR